MGNGTRGSQPKIQPNSSKNDKTAGSFPYGTFFERFLYIQQEPFLLLDVKIRKFVLIKNISKLDYFLLPQKISSSFKKMDLVVFSFHYHHCVCPFGSSLVFVELLLAIMDRIRSTLDQKRPLFYHVTINQAYSLTGQKTFIHNISGYICPNFVVSITIEIYLSKNDNFQVQQFLF